MFETQINVMKKIYSFFVLLSVSFSSFAQVAINTNGATPNSSAMLDISSSNKGVLVPRVNLQSYLYNVTVPNPATSLLVYNTNAALPGGIGYYYNKGTAASPNWQSLQSITLPYYEATNATAAAFTIENYSPVTTSSAIKGNGGGSGRGVEGIANSGTGVYAKSNTGNALEVSGKLKIAGNGQSPLQGKVLTTDDQGNASWQGAVAFSAVGIKYGNHIIPNGPGVKLRFHAKAYDLGYDYTGPDVANHSTFVAPVDGIYHFDVQTRWNFKGSGYSGFSELILWKKVAGVETILSMIDIDLDDEHAAYLRTSIDVKLTAGTEVYTTLSQSSGGDLDLNYGNAGCYFNGHLVVKL